MIFQSSFSFVNHADAILKVCSQRTFLLEQLREQGKPLHQLHTTFQAIILSHLIYAISVWEAPQSPSMLGGDTNPTFSAGYTASSAHRFVGGTAPKHFGLERCTQCEVKELKERIDTIFLKISSLRFI